MNMTPIERLRAEIDALSQPTDECVVTAADLKLALALFDAADALNFEGVHPRDEPDGLDKFYDALSALTKEAP